MRILHVVSGLQQASGVTTFVVHVVRELTEQGHVAEVATRAESGALGRLADFDVVHVHGLWDRFLHRAARLARHAGCRLVWSPHGMLQPWALKNKMWKKVAALALYQWRDLRSVDLLHATADTEVADIRRLRLPNKVVVAPLGVDLPSSSTRAPASPAPLRTLLFVSRVQRKKGLPNLLEAWSRLPADLRTGWRIRIVGPDQDNHTAELKAQCDRLSLPWVDETSTSPLSQSPTYTFSHSHTSTLPHSHIPTFPHSQVHFVGPKYGDALDAEYNGADLFVLPTHSENFGSVVVEALAHGVPVICTKAAPWQELETHGCGWWVEDSSEALATALKHGLVEVVCSPNMRAQARALAHNRYSWAHVVSLLEAAYHGGVCAS